MLLIAMASWIPFRSNSVEQELIMFAKIANPFDYTWATRSVGGYTYILTAVVLLAMLGAYGCKWVHETYAVPRLVVAAAATVSVALMASSILLFMRDVKQFIYFQF
jgi:ABC-type polysaccharide/polyol phosphate export permease